VLNLYHESISDIWECEDDSDECDYEISWWAQWMKNLSETDRKAMIDAVKKAIDAKDYTLFKQYMHSIELR